MIIFQIPIFILVSGRQISFLSIIEKKIQCIVEMVFKNVTHVLFDLDGLLIGK